jgi:glucose-6-phosphate 1-dehydrogenase
MNKPENHIMVIFGASGDLTQRKLIPAIFALYCQEMLPERFAVLGVGRSDLDDAKFRDKQKASLRATTDFKKVDRKKLESFLKLLHFLSFDIDNPEEYSKLKEKMWQLEQSLNIPGNYIYYLATPPSLYELIPQYLKKQELQSESKTPGWKRIIIEKPFGYDLESARKLNKKLLGIFREQQVYRIDHYLGKETVQNLLVFRFSNGFFEPLWNRNYIHHVQITAAEDIGIETRGGYYDGAGAIRDMVQNHLMQLVGLTAMEPPSLFDAESIRNETVKVFQALRPMDEEIIRKNVIRGQYLGSETVNGWYAGYREEKGVDPGSRTDTYVAMKFFIDNWRWGGVPFYIRTGKRLPTRVTEIVIQMQATPHQLFKGQAPGDLNNKLVMRIQPDEGIIMQFGLKMPGSGYDVKRVKMDFRYADLANVYIPGAYERLLLDCMNGDSTLYLRNDAVEATWKFVDPILKAWKDNPEIKLYGYPAGTWGPRQANDLLRGSAVAWRNNCDHLTPNRTYKEL